jgi:Tfp pilus assembly protein PilV
MKAPASAPRCRGESGYTLSEVLVALFLLVTIVAGIITAMSTSIIASDVHSKTVTADTVIRSYAEALQTVYQDCATPTYQFYQPSAPNINLFNGGRYSGFANGTSIVSIKYWNGDTPATFGSVCPGPPDNGIQLVTIQAVSSDGRAKQTLDVILRRPS